MEKFTNGGWYRANYSARSAATGKFLAHADNNSIDESERMANTHLIVAAPEMFEDIKLDIEWLKRLRSLFVLGSDGFRSCSLRIESKEKLLSKARGE